MRFAGRGPSRPGTGTRLAHYEDSLAPVRCLAPFGGSLACLSPGLPVLAVRPGRPGQAGRTGQGGLPAPARPGGRARVAQAQVGRRNDTAEKATRPRNPRTHVIPSGCIPFQVSTSGLSRPPPSPPATPNPPAKIIRGEPRQNHRARRPTPESGRCCYGPQRASSAAPARTGNPTGAVRRIG